jgi:hypothetical protein
VEINHLLSAYFQISFKKFLSFSLKLKSELQQSKKIQQQQQNNYQTLEETYLNKFTLVEKENKNLTSINEVLKRNFKASEEQLINAQVRNQKKYSAY